MDDSAAVAEGRLRTEDRGIRSDPQSCSQAPLIHGTIKHCIQLSSPGGPESDLPREPAMTPHGTIWNPDLELERYLHGLRSEPAHSRFSMQELDGGLVVLDIAYSTDGFVYVVRC
jgi:hypothetical protein